MIRHALIILLLAVATCRCHAETKSASVEVPVQRIVYVRHLPDAAAKRLPQGVRSRFAGFFQLAPDEQPLLLHLYPKNAEEDLNRSGWRDIHFTVDIFKATRSRKTKTYRLVTTFPLTYKAESKPSRFGAQLLWLDPKQHRQPILKFDCLTQSGEYPAAGDHVLAVFSHGLRSKPVVQSFDFGLFHSSNVSKVENRFDSVDERGLLQVRTSYSLTPGETLGSRPTLWRWNGEKFAVVPNDPAESQTPGLVN